MTKKEKWIVDEDDGLRLFYGDENFNGSAYPCNDIVFMKIIADKLNKLEDENEQLRKENQRLSEQKHIYKQDWKHLCIDKELLDSENEQLKEHIKDLRLNVLDSIHEANEIQCSCNPCVVEECVKKVVE